MSLVCSVRRPVWLEQRCQGEGRKEVEMGQQWYKIALPTVWSVVFGGQGGNQERIRSLPRCQAELCHCHQEDLKRSRRE